jgi:hypothetical protein
MVELPAFIEVSPGEFKPLDACTRDEVVSAQVRYAQQGVSDAREAVQQAEDDGRTSSAGDRMWHGSEDNQWLAEALGEYIAQHWPDA